MHRLTSGVGHLRSRSSPASNIAGLRAPLCRLRGTPSDWPRTAAPAPRIRNLRESKADPHRGAREGPARRHERDRDGGGRESLEPLVSAPSRTGTSVRPIYVAASKEVSRPVGAGCAGVDHGGSAPCTCGRERVVAALTAPARASVGACERTTIPDRMLPLVVVSGSVAVARAAVCSQITACRVGVS
jgi:hypothetical protein